MDLRAALATCRQSLNPRRRTAIALMVGCMLSIINQGDFIARVLTGDRTARA